MMAWLCRVAGDLARRVNGAHNTFGFHFVTLFTLYLLILHSWSIAEPPFRMLYIKFVCCVLYLQLPQALFAASRKLLNIVWTPFSFSYYVKGGKKEIDGEFNGYKDQAKLAFLSCCTRIYIYIHCTVHCIVWNLADIILRNNHTLIRMSFLAWRDLWHFPCQI